MELVSKIELSWLDNLAVLNEVEGKKTMRANPINTETKLPAVGDIRAQISTFYGRTVTLPCSQNLGSQPNHNELRTAAGA